MRKFLKAIKICPKCGAGWDTKDGTRCPRGCQ